MVISYSLLEQYTSVFSTPLNESEINKHSPNLPPKFTLENVSFDVDDIKKQIKNMPSNAAPGLDGITPKILKACAETISYPIYLLWKKSTDSGQIPDLCKKSAVIPIFKNGKKDLAKNYRPVSLTSHVIKIFERIIKNQVVEFLEQNNLLKNFQHGFRKNRNCLTQLLEHYVKVLESLEKGLVVDVIYLDFAKAFDKVDHGLVIKKAEALGIKGDMLNWLKEFLTNRKQIVLVNGFPSEERNVLSGVPQGTVLGPLLFLIMINDMPEYIKFCDISSFADDTKIIKTISCQEDSNDMQKDIDNAENYTKDNNLVLNCEKFAHIRYDPLDKLKNEHISYKTQDQKPIETKKSVKDLGIIMSSNMKFIEHINTLEIKCRQLIGWILRTFKSREILPMLTLWKSLVITRLDYCSQLWSPYKAGEIQKLEGLQRTFTSYIKEVNSLDYWDRLKALKLYSIERRFERYLIVYIWKIIEQKVCNPDNIKCTEIHSRTGRKISLNHLPNTACALKTIIYNSPINKSKRLFNILPKELRNISNVSAENFKNHLDKLLSQIPDEPGVPGYTGNRTASSNSIIDQVKRIKVESQIQPASIGSVLVERG